MNRIVYVSAAFLIEESRGRKIYCFGCGAAHLALLGTDVALWNRTFEHISVIEQRNGIELDSVVGNPLGFGKLSLVTSDIEQAIAHAQIIMVVLPSSAHRNTDPRVSFWTVSTSFAFSAREVSIDGSEDSMILFLRMSKFDYRIYSVSDVSGSLLFSGCGHLSNRESSE